MTLVFFGSNQKHANFDEVCAMKQRRSDLAARGANANVYTVLLNYQGTIFSVLPGDPVVLLCVVVFSIFRFTDWVNIPEESLQSGQQVLSTIGVTLGSI